MIKRVSIVEAEYVAHRMARELMDYGEPVADFRARYPGRLESCLDHPFTYLNGRFVYWTISHRAAVLFYLLIKNHPFENGNKRMAVTIMLTFLFKNRRWIDTPPDTLYRIAKLVAESPASEKDFMIDVLRKNIKEHLVVLAR
jgi:death-on-curing family protein